MFTFGKEKVIAQDPSRMHITSQFLVLQLSLLSHQNLVIESTTRVNMSYRHSLHPRKFLKTRYGVIEIVFRGTAIVSVCKLFESRSAQIMCDPLYHCGNAILVLVVYSSQQWYNSTCSNLMPDHIKFFLLQILSLAASATAIATIIHSTSCMYAC